MSLSHPVKQDVFKLVARYALGLYISRIWVWDVQPTSCYSVSSPPLRFDQDPILIKMKFSLAMNQQLLNGKGCVHVEQLFDKFSHNEQLLS